MTLREFVGSLLTDISKGRAMADYQSNQIGQLYLKHDVLKGFSVPRMSIERVELEFRFAVDQNLPRPLPSGKFRITYQQKASLIHSISGLIETLPQRPQFHGVFKEYDAEKWEELVNTIQTQLDNQIKLSGQQPRELVRHLVDQLTAEVEQYLHPNALAKFAQVLRDMKGKEEQNLHQFFSTYVQEALSQTILGIDPAELYDVPIIVSADQLSKLPESATQSIKLTVSSDDKRWVKVDDKNDEYIITDK